MANQRVQIPWKGTHIQTFDNTDWAGNVQPTQRGFSSPEFKTHFIGQETCFQTTTLLNSLLTSNN